MRLRNLLAAAAVPAILPLLAAGVASASPQHHHYYHLTARTFMVNRDDSGANGNWAKDTFVRQLTLTPAPGCPSGQYGYTARLDDRGKFTTIPWAYTPNQSGWYLGRHIHGVVRGEMHGFGKFGLFCATKPANMWLVPKFVYGDADSSGTWPELAFPSGTTFTGVNEGTFGYFYTAKVRHHHHHHWWWWGRHHHFELQRWVDASWNGYGDLPGDGNITG